MKILQVHNKYQNPTGDDAVVTEEYELLRSHGHEVDQFLKTNEEISAAGIFKKLRLAISLKRSKATKDELEQWLKNNRPDVVHCHNLFPLITPVVFEVCKDHNIPVVQTLHNYRLLCVNTLFYRDGNICQDCLSSSLMEGVKHSCYNGSKAQSYLMAGALKHHRERNTWNKEVDRFICLSEFAKSKFVQGGIQSNKLIVKANFVKDPRAEVRYDDFFLYAGKLEEQKGLDDFLELAKNCSDLKFKLAGYCDNPEIFNKFDNVEYMGQLERSVLMGLMKNCKGVLFLSRMYEGMPMTILEAFAHKKLVVARNQGAMKEMIQNEENGVLFSSVDELIDAVRSLGSVEKCKSLGHNAYGYFATNYNEDIAYRNLIKIYSEVQAR